MIIQLLRHKPIVKNLAKYLSLETWMILTCLNKYMYNGWIESLDIIDAIKIIGLIRDRFKWNWTLVVENPFKVLRKQMFELRLPFKVIPAKYQCTGGCGCNLNLDTLVTVKFAKYAICYTCFEIPDDWLVSYEAFYQIHIHEVADQLYQRRSNFKQQDPFTFSSVIDRHYNPKIKDPSWLIRVREFCPWSLFAVHKDDIKKRAAADIETFDMRNPSQLRKYFM